MTSCLYHPSAIVYEELQYEKADIGETTSFFFGISAQDGSNVRKPAGRNAPDSIT